jgi:hypothetical protein
MFFAIFQQTIKRVTRGKRGGGNPFGHRFGGPADYAGLQAFPRQPPVHLLFRLNTADPLVGVSLSGAEWLPLLCAIRYGACRLGYRVASNDAVKILHQVEKKAWRGFPTAGFPKALPAQPLDLFEVSYDPADPKEALFYGGVFGFDALTKKQFAKVVRFVTDEGWFNPECGEGETVEDYLRQGAGGPFVQGPPDDGCPDPACRLYNKTAALRPFALFQEDDRSAEELWGPYGENLQIIWQTCPSCGAILVTNQCT